MRPEPISRVAGVLFPSSLLFPPSFGTRGIADNEREYEIRFKRLTPKVDSTVPGYWYATEFTSTSQSPPPQHWIYWGIHKHITIADQLTRPPTGVVAQLIRTTGTGISAEALRCSATVTANPRVTSTLFTFVS